jgi:hypothetical protein
MKMRLLNSGRVVCRSPETALHATLSDSPFPLFAPVSKAFKQKVTEVTEMDGIKRIINGQLDDEGPAEISL